MGNVTPLRRKRAKGRWMRLRDPELLIRYLAARNMSQRRLSKYAGCSQQFINKLARGEKRTCTGEIAARIEEVLLVLPGTLFVEQKSPTTKPVRPKRKTAAA